MSLLGISIYIASCIDDTLGKPGIDNCIINVVLPPGRTGDVGCVTKLK